MKAVLSFLKQRGVTVKTKKGAALIWIEGEASQLIPSSAKFEARWQCPHSLKLGNVDEPLPERYLVVSKTGKAMVIFESGARAFWWTNRGAHEAPLVVGDFFRLDGTPGPPYTRAMLMKETYLKPRRLIGPEANYLKRRDDLPPFRRLANRLREATI